MNKKYILGAFASCVAFLSASANIIPVNLSEVPEGSNFRWNYATFVTADQRVEAGDYFTIYDFGSLIVGSNLQPADWTFSSSLLGITPATVIPMDDPNVLNITWTYTGATPLTGPQFLGIFSVLSETNQMRADNFAALATRTYRTSSGHQNCQHRHRGRASSGDVRSCSHHRRLWPWLSRTAQLGAPSSPLRLNSRSLVKRPPCSAVAFFPGGRTYTQSWRANCLLALHYCS